LFTMVKAVAKENVGARKSLQVGKSLFEDSRIIINNANPGKHSIESPHNHLVSATRH